MKKLIILILVLTLYSCGDSPYKYRAPVKGDVCLELLKQRESARYSDQHEILKETDSLLLRYGCDTLR